MLLEYPSAFIADEVFRYDVEANTTSFFFPEADAPGQTRETCLPRAGFEISVWAILVEDETLELWRTAAHFECSSRPWGSPDAQATAAAAR